MEELNVQLSENDFHIQIEKLLKNLTVTEKNILLSFDASSKENYNPNTIK